MTINNFIEVIDALLLEAEVTQHPWPLHISISNFCNNVPPHDMQKILKKLEREGCVFDIRVLNSSTEWGHAIATAGKGTISLKADKRKLKKYRSVFARMNPNAENAITDGQNTQLEELYLLHKDADGNYFYKNKLVVMGKNTNYYLVLDALYSSSDQDGFLSYGDIEKHMVRFGKNESKNEKERNRRILNAINDWQGIFRFAKVNGHKLQNKNSKGGKLIEIIRGEGLKLHNSKI